MTPRRGAPYVVRAGLGLAIALAARVPPRWLIALGRAVAPLLLALIPSLRADLAANARRVLGRDSPIERRRALARGTLAHFARFVIELASPAPAVDARLFAEMEGRAHVDRARAMGKGIVAVSLHLGNYEAGSALLAQMEDAPVAIVYARDPSGLFDALRSRRRGAGGLIEIATDGSMFHGARALAVLRAGGMVLAAGDLGAPGLRGRSHRFFGGTASFAELPLALALATGAPLLPCFVVRRGRAYHLQVWPPIVPAPGDDADRLLDALVPIFERVIARDPAQWLVVHRYWDDDR